MVPVVVSLSGATTPATLLVATTNPVWSAVLVARFLRISTTPSGVGLGVSR